MNFSLKLVCICDESLEVGGRLICTSISEILGRFQERLPEIFGRSVENIQPETRKFRCRAETRATSAPLRKCSEWTPISPQCGQRDSCVGFILCCWFACGRVALGRDMAWYPLEISSDSLWKFLAPFRVTH